MRTFKIQSVIFLALLIAGACQVWGSDLQTRQSSLYPFQSTVQIQEEFMSGTAASGQIGALSFGTTGGTGTNQASETNRPGLFRMDTTAVINTIATVRLLVNTQTNVDPASTHTVTWIGRLNTNDANTTIRYGSQNTAGASPPADGIYFEKLSADTNWFCVTRSGGVQTRTDSTIATTGNFVNFTYIRNSSGVLFYINGVLVATHTTNITTTFINPSMTITNTAAAAKTVDLDYFQLTISELVR